MKYFNENKRFWTLFLTTLTSLKHFFNCRRNCTVREGKYGVGTKILSVLQNNILYHASVEVDWSEKKIKITCCPLLP